MYLFALLLAVTVPGNLAFVVNKGTECLVYPESLYYGGYPVDDTPSILQAFELCGTNGSVVLTDNVFHINQVMNTTNLLNCDVSLHGEMRWSTNVPYWLSHSYSVIFQGLSTAWLFGGTNVTFRGYGTGLLNGQGQVWYDENRNNSNQPGRPVSITFYNSTNLYVDGLRWKQSQFWSSFISYSTNVTMTNIHMSSISNTNTSTVNTDGTDTWNSRDIVLKNWTVTNGDDCIAVKGNTTNLYASNIRCIGGVGLPIGSVGQYPLTPDYVQDILFEDCVVIDSQNGAYIKTWQGVPATVTGNGDSGGGGRGFVKNVTWRNIEVIDVGIPIFVTQCIYGGNASVCDTSKMQISDITWENVHGTSAYNLASSIHCVPQHPCPGMKFIDVNITSVNASIGAKGEVYQCANIVHQNATGKAATGIPCNAWAPNNVSQIISADV